MVMIKCPCCTAALNISAELAADPPGSRSRSYGHGGKVLGESRDLNARMGDIWGSPKAYKQIIPCNDGSLMLLDVSAEFCEGDKDEFMISYDYTAKDGTDHHYAEIMTPATIKYVDGELIQQVPNALGYVPMVRN
jgi:hypothetical protein